MMETSSAPESVVPIPPVNPAIAAAIREQDGLSFPEAVDAAARRAGLLAAVPPRSQVARPLQFAPPPPAPATLVDAVNLVARAVNARIALLQSEIDALRAALRPFAQAAQPTQPPIAPDANDQIQQLLEIAGRLKPTE